MDSRAVNAGMPRTAPTTDAALYLHPQTLSRLGSMEMRARHIVEGVMSGMHRSPYQGFSVEFAQHRPYVPGDDIRHLDWKVYGRTDKLHLKQYQQETSLDLMVMVDASGSMNYGSRDFAEASGVGAATSPDGRSIWTKFDHATALAAALSYITLSQGDRVGLAIFADQVREMVARSSAQPQWRAVVGALSCTTVDRTTDVGRVIEQTLAKITNRCLLVIISDFFVELEQLRAALARVRHRRHDMIAMQVLDRQELAFDFAHASPFEGLEGESRVRIDPRAIRAAYQREIGSHVAGVERLVRSFGYDYVRVDSHDWLGPPLAAYLAQRNAQIKRSKHG
ncbi:MAG: DUF58 domain-containing protein [Phycisphaeraceae bacterium]|nr:DUF58 domain-containing protein [Phycisphaeraceae bacterium]MCW5754163.1 DUF58 domain-containing protein [Phycisphaeraceae bacterium]